VTQLTKLLITGERRSGTTLFANLMDAQKGVSVYRDFLHIERIRKSVGAHSLCSFLEKRQKERVISYFGSTLTTERLDSGLELKESDFDNLVDFYCHVLQGVARPGDSVVGHKTTRAHGVIYQLLRLVPNLKVIYVVRDPRDVTISALRRFPRESWFEHIQNWRESYTMVRKLAQKSEMSSNIMILRYEDLILHSDTVLFQVAVFLGCSAFTVPNAITDYGQEWQDNSSFNDLTRILDTTPIGRWEREDPAVVRRVEVELYEMMMETGYLVSRRLGTIERLHGGVLGVLHLLARRPKRLLRRIKAKFRLLLLVE
jgi:hypothetical protein